MGFENISKPHCKHSYLFAIANINSKQSLQYKHCLTFLEISIGWKQPLFCKVTWRLTINCELN